MNKLIATIPVIALLAPNVQASGIDYQKMAKQLDIMENIISSSLKSNDKKASSKLSGIDSTYLNGQGVVFTISSSSRLGHWGNYNFNFAMPSAPPVPPQPVEINEHQMAQIEAAAELADIDIEATVAEAMEVAAESYEQALDSLNDHRSEFRDLRDDQRDLAYEMRDLEREQRDIEYQIRRAEKQQKKEMQAKKKEVEKQKVKIKAQLKEVQKRSAALQKKKAQEYEKREETRIAYYQKLSYQLTDTLCLYGNGLKALPKQEKITLVLKGGGERVERHYQDQILVFNKRDINACAIDEMTSEQLIKKAISYQF